MSQKQTALIEKKSSPKRSRVMRKLRWLLLVSLALIAVLLYAAMRSNVDSAAKNLLISLTRQKILQIVSLVDREILLARVMAQSTAICAYLADSTDVAAAERGKNALLHYARNFTSKKIFWVNDRDKNFQFFNGYRIIEYPMDPSLPDNYWYNATLDSTLPYFVNINYNNDLRETCVWVNIPLRHNVADTRAYAMLGCGINLSDLVFDIYHNLSDDINLLFFNQKNEIVGSKNFGEIIEKIHLADNHPARAQIENLRAVFSAQDNRAGRADAGTPAMREDLTVFTTRNRIICFTYIPLLDWFVISEIKRTPLMIHEMRLCNLEYWTFLGVFALLILVAWLIHRIINQNHRLRQMGNRAMAASNAKSNFLSLMSHELRTPINAVTGMSELIIRESTSPKICKYAETVSHAGQNLLALITNIIDYSRLETWQFELSPAAYSLREMLEEVIALIRAKINGRPIMFTVDIAPSCPDKLIGDLPRVRQILITLLGNAVKHTEKGAVNFRLTSHPDLEKKTTALTAIVSDTGRGISKENLKNVFIGFGKFNNAINVSEQGAGVELAIAYNLAKVMGGNLQVHSDYGRGCTFTALIPQTVEDFTPLIATPIATDKSALLIESRKPYAVSIMNTMRDLKIPCRRATDLISAAKILRSFAQEAGNFGFAAESETAALKPFSHIFIAAGLFDDALRLLAEIYNEQKNSPQHFVAGKSLLLRLVTDDSLTTVNDDSDNSYRQRANENINLPFAARIINTDLPLWALPLTAIINCNTEQEIAAQLQFDWTAPDARILIVDDLEVNLLVLEGMLQQHRIKVEVCDNGKEALEMVAKMSAADKPFHLVFMDYMMPNMDGIEATVKIREIDKRVSVVALTADKAEEVRKTFLAQGACGFLSKPINPTTLTQCLLSRLPRGLIIRRDTM